MTRDQAIRLARQFSGVNVGVAQFQPDPRWVDAILAASTSVITEEQARVAFEADCLGCAYSIVRGGSGSYVAAGTFHRWDGFRAAMRLVGMLEE